MNAPLGSQERLCEWPPALLWGLTVISWRVRPEVLLKLVGCGLVYRIADLALTPLDVSSMVWLNMPEAASAPFDIASRCFPGTVYSFLLFFFIFSIQVSLPCYFLFANNAALSAREPN